MLPGRKVEFWLGRFPPLFRGRIYLGAAPSLWSGHALLRRRRSRPLPVSALRVSIVAAEPAGRGRSPKKVAYVARALDTTTRHQRTIARPDHEWSVRSEVDKDRTKCTGRIVSSLVHMEAFLDVRHGCLTGHMQANDPKPAL